MQKKKPICITMGEPSGISAEIIIKVWDMRKKLKIFPFFIFDDPERLEKMSNFLGIKVPIKIIHNESESLDIFDEYLPVKPLSSKIEFKLFNSNFKNSKYIFESISSAVQSALQNKVSGVITSPVCKKMLGKYGFKCAGQTEYISEIVSRKKKNLIGHDLVYNKTCRQIFKFTCWISYNSYTNEKCLENCYSKLTCE